MFFKRKKKKDKLWKRLLGLSEKETSYYKKSCQKIQEMSDEEFLLCYKRLYLKSFLISGLGVGLFCLSIFLIVYLF